MEAIIPTKPIPTSELTAPPLRLAVGITGHRETNPAYAANHAAIAASLAALLAELDVLSGVVKPRLHSLLANGSDLDAVEVAVARGWQVAAPLPFGLALNIAINALPANAAEASLLLAGKYAGDSPACARGRQISMLAEQVDRFELAEADAAITDLFIATLSAPGDATAQQAFSTAASDRAALAGRVMIEQSDLIIAIWDGETPGMIGGTRHTIACALELGAPVIWIDARAPQHWHILDGEEVLANLPLAGAEAPDVSRAAIRHLVKIVHGPGQGGTENFGGGAWRPHSRRRFHAYRRIEALFGGIGIDKRLARLSQKYETPDEIGDGSGAALLKAARALPGGDARLTAAIETSILRRFSWVDGLSTYLSDAYRGGMVASFIASSLAIIGGIAYLPFVDVSWKWPFALFEFVLLISILAVTWIGNSHRWHTRWFETRRLAEYLRHAPILLLLGVARPAGRWPSAARTSWPELYARSLQREIGLPRIRLDEAYLRALLATLLGPHVVAQRDYHRAKARRLSRAHHNLDRLSQALFMLAVLSVASYLMVVILARLGIVSHEVDHAVAKPLTFLGVMFPTLGAAFAGIRYFGDFERFAAISEVTAEKLTGIEKRITRLAQAPQGKVDFARISDIAHATDDVVVTEIESWQAVFGGKTITVPV
jgi:hypothetical protein